MPMIKKIYLALICLLFFNHLNAQEVKKIGKFKDWETIVFVSDSSEKVCFAQSKPVLQSPKSKSRDARLFVSFRPKDNIIDEYKFDISQENFAWIADNKIEKKMIKVMKKASRIMITGYNKSGSQTIDHYSLMGFTKAYNSAKKSCT